jgi:hypothetical protein
MNSPIADSITYLAEDPPWDEGFSGMVNLGIRETGVAGKWLI